MKDELSIKIMDYVTEYVNTFSGEYNNEVSESLKEKICRLELYVPLPAELLGINTNDEFAGLVRVKTCIDYTCEIMLLHNGHIVKPNKHMGELVNFIANGGTAEYINDWGNTFM